MANPVRIPGPESVGSVGIARDPGVRANAQQFGAGIGEALADFGATAAAIGAEFYQKRKAVEDEILTQRDELESSTLAAKAYLNMQGEAGNDPDNFHARVGETLNAGFAELDKKYANEGMRVSAEARRAMQARRANLLENYTLRGVTDGHNARVVQLGRTVETNLSQIGTQLAEDGDIAAAGERATAALGSLSQLVDPAEMEKARQSTNAQLGKSVNSYLDKLQDEAVAAETNEEREAYKVQAEALIDQATAKGYYDAAIGADNKRIWRQNFENRVLKSMEPQEQLRALGVGPGRMRNVNLPQDVQGRAATARDKLVSLGWSPTQAAGIVGNLVQESGVRHDGPSGDSGSAHGIAQWRGDRFAALKSFAAKKGTNWRDFDTQLEFLDWELRNSPSERTAFNRLQSAQNVEDATAAFIGFERPRGYTDANPSAGHGWSNRLAAAQQVAGVEVTAGSQVLEQAQGDSFFSDMPADVRQQAIIGAQADLARNNSEYMSGVEDYAAYLSAGNAPDGRYSAGELAYNLGPEKGAEVSAALADAVEYGEDVAALRMASPEEAQAIIASRQAELGSPEDFVQNARELGGLQDILKARYAAITADPAGYVATYDDRSKAAYAALQAAPPEEQAAAAARYATSVLGAQQKLGVPASMQSILSNSAVAGIAEQFKFQPEGGADAAKLMQGLEARWGKHFPKVFSQLVKDGHLPAPAMVIGTMNHEGQRLAAAQLSEAANMGAAGLEKVIPKEAVKAIDDDESGVASKTNGLRASLAFNGESGVNTANAFSESIRLLSMYYVYQGDDPANALYRATENIVDKGYEFPEVNERTIRVPIEQDAGAVQSGATSALRSFNAADVELPEDDFGLDEGQLTESYTNAIRASGFWVTNDDETGLTLRDGRGVPVVRADGSLYSLTWGELTAAGFADEVRRVEERKRTIQQAAPQGAPGLTVPTQYPPERFPVPRQ